MATSRANYSPIFASARIFLAIEIVRSLVPLFTRIELLIRAKFLSRIKVLSESFMILEFSFIIIEGRFHDLHSYH